MDATRVRQGTVGEDFTIYGWGILYASVCSSLPPAETEARLNRDMPSGTTYGWAHAPEPFTDGTPNPCPCHDFPETHKHYLFRC